MRPLLRLHMSDEHGQDGSAEEWLRRNVIELMAFYRMKQTVLAERMGRSQSWLSRRLSGRPWDEGGSRFQFEDLDRLATVFGLSPAELLQPKYGQWDRRRAGERRCGTDRRQTARRAPEALAADDPTPPPWFPPKPPDGDVDGA
jgi:transcriptional regulator with XRE-family HTH domain